MRRNPTKDIEQYRLTDIGQWSSTAADGANGAFMIPVQGVQLNVLASDGSDWPMEPPPWEHVSVSLPRRCPTWEEMDAIKRIFWRDDETVLQFHVPRSEHINCHPYCLHLWKLVGCDIPRPPLAAVGPSAKETQR